MKYRVCIIAIIAVLIAGAAMGADLTVEKWSGDLSVPVDPFAADGLTGDPENSYAWSMAEFGGYIYAGTNRNYLRQILETAGASGLTDLMDAMFPIKIDAKAKIYRKPSDGSGDWELFYESPMVDITLDGNPMSVILDNGYRGMEVWNNSLYIVTYSFFSSPYSRLLRLSDPQGTGADLEEVLRVENTGGSGLRELVIFNDSLLVGTEDLKMFRSTSPPEQGPVVTPIAMVTVLTPIGINIPCTTADLGGKTGWTLAGNASTFPGITASPGWSGIWDNVVFNGFLYTSIADPTNGFSLFKTDGTPSGVDDLWVWTPVVAKIADNPEAKYPQGLGNTQNTAVTMVEFKGKVYAGTFSSWNDILKGLIGGVADPSTLPGAILKLLENWTPPQLYRFGANDSWEMIVGDPRLSSPIFDSSPLSGWRAGFFVNPDPLFKNLSTNRYIWRMKVYNDHLFMGTMDMRPILEVLTENILGAGYQPAIHSALLHLQQIFEQANPTDPSGFDLFATVNGTTIEAITRDGGFGEIFGKFSTGDKGDRHNYGARTLITGDGLFLGTANPFYGCQIWKLKYPDPEPEPEPKSGGGGCSSGGGSSAALLLLPLAAAYFRGRKGF